MNALDRLQSLQVADAMSKKVISVSASDSMDAAARILGTHGVSAVPVVDNEGVCVGILSAVDFLRRTMEQGKGDTVAHWMSSAVQTVAAYAPLLLAARIMRDGHIHRLPVLDRHGKPVGVISTLDIVAAQLNAVEEMEARLGTARNVPYS